MSFNVQIAASVEQTVHAWGLPPALTFQVYTRLFELSDDPFSKLRSVNAPVPAYLFAFVLPDPNDTNCRHAFQFAVQVAADEQSLTVMDAGHSAQITHVQPPRADRNGGVPPLDS